MTINRVAYNGDLNIYFHMKNHYKKIRNVKSTIDNSAPKGFRKSCPTPTNSPASLGTGTSANSGERQVKSCLHLSREKNDPIKQISARHSVESQSETCMRSSSLPPRPITRRHPFEMPHKLQCKMRSHSVGPTSRKDVYMRLNNKVTKKRRSFRGKNKNQPSAVPQSENKKDANPESDETGNLNDGRRSRLTCQSRGKLYSRTEEQEYLHFLLRITEDIIINNYHTSEDVERVFQNHVQANKGHLKMEKMRAQLARLCGELNIPYNNNGTVFRKEDCYPDFFNSDLYNGSCHQHFDNCECMQNRILNLERDQDKFPQITDEGEQDNFNLANDMMQMNICSCKHSLSRVTECTEPCNSLDTLITSTKHPSGTTVSSLGNADILPGLDNGNTKIDKGLFEEVVGRILSREMTVNKEPPLTEKEKYSCVEEMSIYQKFNDKLPVEFEDKYVVDAINFVTVIKDDKQLPSDKLNADEEILEKSVHSVDNTLNGSEIELDNKETSDEAENLQVTKLDQNSLEIVQNDNPVLEIADQIKAGDSSALKITYSKHTQMSASCADKQCNTSLKLNGQTNNDDYVLVNGPIYVLKTLLDSDEGLILYDNRLAIENISKDSIRPPSCAGSNSDFSKLLNSDYDLTPQRETNSGSAKYHHLSVDASTSISNMDKRLISNLNYEGLLLSESYAMKSRNELERYRKLENGTFFTEFMLPNGSQYDIESYAIQKEANMSVGFCGCSIGSQAGHENGVFGSMTEQDVSLGQYEIYSQDDNFGENYSIVDMSEGSSVEDIPKVEIEEANSHMSSIRSEGIQNSSKFPNMFNILGKRKLKHS